MTKRLSWYIHCSVLFRRKPGKSCKDDTQASRRDEPDSDDEAAPGKKTIRSIEERLANRYRQRSQEESEQEDQMSDEPPEKKGKRERAVDPLTYRIPHGLEDTIKPQLLAREQFLKEAMENDSDIRWEPNSNDIKLWKKMVVSKILKRSKNVIQGLQGMSEKSRQEIQRGEMPSDKEDFMKMPSTPRHYKLGWTRLMNVLSIINHRCVRMKDFLRFGEVELIEPRNIVEKLEEHISCLDVIGWSVSVYKYILSYQAEAATENIDKFLPLIRDQDSLTPVQLQEEMKIKANNFSSEINNTIAQIDGTDIHRKIANLKKAQEKSNSEDKKKHEGIEPVPDPLKIIPQFLQYSKVRRNDEEIVQAAENKTVVSKETLAKFTNHILSRVIIRNPHRKQIYNNATLKDVLEGFRKPGIYFPYRQLQVGEKGDQGYEKDIVTLEGGIQMVWDSNNSREDLPEALKGRVVIVKHHKTSHKWGSIKWWISPVDELLMRCYHAVVENFAKANGLIYDLNQSFFVTSSYNKENKKMNPYLGWQNKVRIDWTNLKEATGLQDFHSHQSRKMFSTTATASTSILLKEAAAVAAAHSPEMMKTTYVAESYRTVQALTSSAWYSQHVFSEGMETNLDLTFLDLGQEERLSETYKEIDKQDFDKWMSKIAARDRRKTLSAERSFGDEEKIAMLTLLMDGGDFIGGDWGPELDYHENYLTGKSLVNREKQRNFLLLLDFMSSEGHPAAKVLVNNMANMAYNKALEEEEQDLQTLVRLTELEWTHKLMDNLRKMSDSRQYSSVSNPRLKFLLVNFNKEHSWRFCFKNEKLKEHLQRQDKFSERQMENSSRDSSKDLVLPSEALKRLGEDTVKYMSDESKKKERKRIEHKQASDKDAEVTSKGSENMEDDFFDNVPDVPEDEYVQKATVFTPSKEEGEQSIRIRDHDSDFSQTIKMKKGQALIVEQLNTPEKGRNFYSWTPEMELFLLERWVEKAENPFYKGMRNKRRLAYEDLEEIRKEPTFRSIITDYEPLWLKLTKPRMKPAWVPEDCTCFMELLDWWMIQKLREHEDGEWSKRKLLDALPDILEFSRDGARSSKDEKKKKRKKKHASLDDSSED